MRRHLDRGQLRRHVCKGYVAQILPADANETFKPKPYVNKLPESLEGRPVIVIDPMLATGGSLVATIRLLLERGAPSALTAVCALCAPEGVDRLREAGLSLHVVTAAIDDHLNDQAFIVPGLGDAGDRQFGPPA